MTATSTAPVVGPDVSRDEDVTPTRFARAAALGAVVMLMATLVVGVVTAGSGPSSVVAGTLGSGTLEALHDGTWEALEPGDVVPRGVDLRSPTGAVLGLGGGAVELAPDTTGLRAGDVFDLSAGTVVVTDDVVVSVTSGLVQVAGRGAWRVDAGAAARVAVYDGGVTGVDAGDRTVVLSRGEQLAVTGDRLTGDVGPLRYDALDPFDRRLLPDAIAVDDFLDATARGLQADYGTSPQRAAFYTDFDGLEGDVVAALRPLAFTTDGDRFGPPAAVLTAAVVTGALVEEAGLTPVAAAREVDDARRDGARYGLVTHLHDVGPGAVRRVAGNALTLRRTLVAAGEGAPVAVASPVVPVVSPTPSEAPTGAPTTPSVRPSPTPGPSATPSPSPSPSPGPTPEPTPSEDPGTTGQVVDDVEDVVGPLDDLIGEEGAEIVDDTTELVDDLLDPDAVTDGIGGVTEGVIEGLTDGFGPEDR